MTIQTNDRRKEYLGNGVATVFTGPRAMSAAHIAVYSVVTATNVATLLTSGYTLTGVGGSSTKVTMDTAPATGTTLLILRTVPYEQAADISNQGSYLPETLENSGLDPLAQQTQQLADLVGRSLRFPETAVGINTLLPAPLPNRFVVVNGANDGFGYADAPPSADLTLRGDLANPASTRGAALVAVQDAANNFAGATVEAALAELAGRDYLTPEQFGAVGDGVADDCAALDAAILAAKAAGGGVVRLKPGKTYLLKTVRYGTGTALRMGSNTTIMAYGATIKRGSAAVNLMLSNDSDGTVGGYTANTDIVILGGTWDPNYPGIAGASMPMGFVHSSRIRIRDAHMFSGFGSHHIELNACSDALVQGCTFEGGAEQADETMEAIQIDGAISTAQWAVGPFDNTFCSNIKVQGNTFKNCGSGVGSHSAVAGVTHTSIEVIGNSFSQMYFCGVRALNWENSIISNNIFYGGLHAIKAYAGATTIASGLTISGNQISHAGLTADGAAGDGHAIYLLGNSALTQQVQQFAIIGNVIRDTTDSKSSCGIKIDWCGQGLVKDNVIVNCTVDGINIFGAATNGGILVTGNRVSGASNIDINVSTVTAVSILGNQCATLKYTSLLKGLIMHNNVFNTGGITSGGTNTNTTVKDNLQNTTFA